MIVEVQVSEISTGKIDADEVIRAYPVEWEDFLDGEANTDELKFEFVRDSAAEVGKDLLNEFASEYDTTYESEVRRV